MIKKAVRFAVALGAGIGMAVVAIPGAASAANNGYAWACWKAPDDRINGGCAKLYANGEILRVEDMQADGWGVRAQIQKYVPDSKGVKRWVNHSTPCFDDTSTSNTNGGMTVCNYNTAENIPIRVHIWASRNGVYKYHNYSPSIKS
ncbi:hypothetical protein GA0070606_0338 [Micromonospora citrea]|uniref:Peptidase inhibitor family I36 n=1 Tax=Micromonospora citrea TaxID=47855 RepID=A0A1C6TSD6_9ACTN|nr:hypothetical protein [Micromonospora citrea]SCL44541.1 hypothetical protein GA0070606_0338 [Micromonospora citrea]